MAKIYVASSWRNKYFPEVVIALRGRFGSAGVGGYLRAGTSLWPQRSYGGGLDGRSWEESCRLYS